MSRYHDQVDDARFKIIAQALAESNGSRAGAARRLGLQRTYLCRLMLALGLQDYRRGPGRPRRAKT